jgi:NADH-quinone oxidoreductase subunit J
MPTPLFYLFAILMIAGGVCVVALKNPVSSAMGMIGSFVGLAALLIGLNAYFVGTLQVLVYAGAIMVLFIFIIMLLDLKKEERKETSAASIATGVFVSLLFILIMVPVFSSVNSDFTKLDKKALAAAEADLPISEVPADSAIREKLKEGQLADVNMIGQKLFTDYNFPLQVVGVLLLVATIGCVTLSKKLHGDDSDEITDHRMAKTIAKSDTIPQVSSASGDTKKATKAAEQSNS